MEWLVIFNSASVKCQRNRCVSCEVIVSATEVSQAAQEYSSLYRSLCLKYSQMKERLFGAGGVDLRRYWCPVVIQRKFEPRFAGILTLPGLFYVAKTALTMMPEIDVVSSRPLRLAGRRARAASAFDMSIGQPRDERRGLFCLLAASYITLGQQVNIAFGLFEK